MIFTPRANLLGCRFVHSIKDPDTLSPIYTARLVAQGPKDGDKDYPFHTSTTESPSYLRLLARISAQVGWDMWIDDITQKFLQSRDRLGRDVFIKPPKVLVWDKESSVNYY